MVSLFGVIGEPRHGGGFDRCLDEALQHGRSTTTNASGGRLALRHLAHASIRVPQVERLYWLGCWMFLLHMTASPIPNSRLYENDPGSNLDPTTPHHPATNDKQ